MVADKKLASHHEWQVTIQSTNEHKALLFLSHDGGGGLKSLRQRLLYVEGRLGSAREVETQ